MADPRGFLEVPREKAVDAPATERTRHYHEFVVEPGPEAGLLLVSAGEHTVRILPPLVITQDDLGRGLAILEQVLTA